MEDMIARMPILKSAGVVLCEFHTIARKSHSIEYERLLLVTGILVGESLEAMGGTYQPR